MHVIVVMVLHPFYSATAEMGPVSVLLLNSSASFLQSPGAPQFLWLFKCKWLEITYLVFLTLLEKENHLHCMMYLSRELVCILHAFSS